MRPPDRAGAHGLPDPRGQAGALLRSLPEGGQVPGLAIRALYRGTDWFTAGYGLADLGNPSPVDPEKTVFRVASISKPITATALARMVAAGMLELEEPLRAYVPEFPERHGRVTLRQLAAHTAGLRAYRGREAALNLPLSIAESLHLFVEDPLEFKPGEGYGYNSFDSVLLSLAMERAGGKPFGDLVEDLVLRPLGMARTHMEVPGMPVPGQAKFYTRRAGGFRPATPVDTRFKLAGGGYLSTVYDICRLGQAYLGGRIAPREVLEPFLTTQQVGGAPTHYGLGWQVSRDAAGRPYFGHVGNAVGGYSNFYIYPESGLVVCVLINCSVPGTQQVLDAAIEALHQSLPSPPDRGEPALS